MRLRLEIGLHNDEDKTLMLQAGANILSKYYQKCRNEYKFLEKYFDNSTNKELVGDLKILLWFWMILFIWF